MTDLQVKITLYVESLRATVGDDKSTRVDCMYKSTMQGYCPSASVCDLRLISEMKFYVVFEMNLIMEI